MSEVSAQRSTAPAAAAAAGPGDPLTLFAFLWAAAALFHVLSPTSPALNVWSNPTASGFAHVVLSICAVWLLARPAHNLPLMLVAGLGLVTAWLEAPFLGNHWLLAAFVNLALLLTTVATLRGGRIDRDRLARAFLPLARWCLVGFYAFAAFAKLNADFFDTAASCSNFYFDETFGGLLPPTVGAGGMAQLLPLGTVITELSVPILLVIRYTRGFGVVLGLAFHSLIALDLAHLFYDFSAVLAALFTLFLPAGFAASALGFLNGRGTRLRVVWGALLGVAMISQWIGGPAVAVFAAGVVLGWLIFDVVVLAGVTGWLVRNRGQGVDHPFRLRGPVWLALVPALVLVNGVLPYVELRTAYAYTMYSNLRMVDGASNHLVIRSSLPLAHRQADLVTIVSSDDPGLTLYAENDYLLPWDSFRSYLADHPGAAVTYERAGLRRVVARAADDPELVDAPPLLLRKLLGMRAVDGTDRNRCQNVFLPAL